MTRPATLVLHVAACGIRVALARALSRRGLARLRGVASMLPGSRACRTPAGRLPARP